MIPMTLVATCGIENGQNHSIIGVPLEIDGESLYLKQITIATNVFVLSVGLALYFFVCEILINQNTRTWHRSEHRVFGDYRATFRNYKCLWLRFISLTPIYSG